MQVVSGAGLPSIELVGHKQNPFVSMRAVHAAGDADPAVMAEFKSCTVRRGGTDPEWADPATATFTLEVRGGG